MGEKAQDCRIPARDPSMAQSRADNRMPVVALALCEMPGQDYIQLAVLRGASGEFFPGALMIPRELSLTRSVDRDTRCPPTQ